MTHPGKTKSALFVVALAAIGLSALFASAASAATVAAKFSSPYFNLTSSAITVKKGGAEAKTCSPSPAIETIAEGSSYLGTNDWTGVARFYCPGGTTLDIVYHGNAYYDTVTGRYFLRLSDWTSSSLASPYGFYTQNTGSTATGTWVNGSGATASKVTYTNQVIGYQSGKAISIDGTLTAAEPGGGLVTLSH